MTVLAGEAVKKRNELSDNDLVDKCMTTLRKIFAGEVSENLMFIVDPFLILPSSVKLYTGTIWT